MSRLPTVGGDDNSWGLILNDFLNQAHQPDGSLKPNSVGNSQIQTNAITVEQISNAGQPNGVALLDVNGNPITATGTQVVTATSLDTAMANLIKNNTSASTSSLDTIFAHAYTPQAYGAKGDGATDDTAAIQAALDAAYAAGGGTVYVPVGTYSINPNPGLQVKSDTLLIGAGAGTVFKLKNGSTYNDNLIKSENWTNVILENFTVDGNRTNQAGTPGAYTYTQYGVYLGGTSNSIVRNVHVINTTGVGFHVYNCNNVVIDSCTSTNNNYHGYEIEQDTGCQLINSRGNSNLTHGVLISPGEVNATGSKGNRIIGNEFDSNRQYGVATNAANGDVSAWLNEGTVINANTITSNALYGVNFYKQDRQIFTNNYVAMNGYFGLYAFESSDNIIQGNTFINNSQASNGSYDEIMMEGNSSGHPAQRNIVASNKIIINATTKARWAINEATSGDGPNTIFGNDILGNGTSGNLNIQNTTTVSYVDQVTTQAVSGVKTFTDGIAVAANASLPGAVMGMDAPFGVAALRIYNNNNGGNLQFVSPNGNSDWYAGGQNTFSVTNTQAIAQKNFKIAAPSVPTTATSAGEAGQLAWDVNYFYVCVAANTWKRIAISAW